MAEKITQSRAREIWIHAQRLTTSTPFGIGETAVRAAVEHLGYVQIDTINVIERCHHHILYNRIPGYQPSHLAFAQSKEKSVFEYWTHALAYVPVKDFAYFMKGMRAYQRAPSAWLASVKPADTRKILRTIKAEGALTIRDIDGDVLVEKTHPWGSKKPSKKALELAFFSGQVVISERIGMLKKYELTERHFGWEKPPKAATEGEVLNFRLDRALRSQGFVSLESVAYLEPSAKPLFAKVIGARVKRGELLELEVAGLEKVKFWIEPGTLGDVAHKPSLTHLLSPFDPLVIQRKRLNQFFGHDHRFEAYLPKEKRVFGYFALPVLMDDRVVALLDLKTDRAGQELLIQKWSWLPKMKSKEAKRRIEAELSRFEDFQLGRSSSV